MVRRERATWERRGGGRGQPGRGDLGEEGRRERATWERRGWKRRGEREEGRERGEGRGQVKFVVSPSSGAYLGAESEAPCALQTDGPVDGPEKR
jgi:hypothetical protein